MKSQNSSIGSAGDVRASMKQTIWLGSKSGIRWQTKFVNNCTSRVPRGIEVSSRYPSFLTFRVTVRRAWTERQRSNSHAICWTEKASCACSSLIRSQLLPIAALGPSSFIFCKIRWTSGLESNMLKSGRTIICGDGRGVAVSVSNGGGGGIAFGTGGAGGDLSKDGDGGGGFEAAAGATCGTGGGGTRDPKPGSGGGGTFTASWCRRHSRRMPGNRNKVLQWRHRDPSMWLAPRPYRSQRAIQQLFVETCGARHCVWSALQSLQVDVKNVKHDEGQGIICGVMIKNALGWLAVFFQLTSSTHVRIEVTVCALSFEAINPEPAGAGASAGWQSITAWLSLQLPGLRFFEPLGRCQIRASSRPFLFHSWKDKMGPSISSSTWKGRRSTHWKKMEKYTLWVSLSRFVYCLQHRSVSAHNRPRNQGLSNLVPNWSWTCQRIMDSESIYYSGAHFGDHPIRRTNEDKALVSIVLFNPFHVQT